MSVAIRPATAADAPAVARLIAGVAAERRWIATLPPVDQAARAERFVAALREGRAASFVALERERVVGELTLLVRDEHLVVGMCVAPPQRGRGIGGALLDAALLHAPQLGRPVVRLDVFAHNTAARRLYVSRGFAPSGETAWLPRDDEMWEVVTMERPVAEPAR